MSPILIALLGAAALVVLYGIALYNGLVARQTQVETEWSQIDVALKRRSDLVPNLVEVVKDYMGYEQETLTAVVEVVRRSRHPQYLKTVQQSKRYYAHDEENDLNEGDRVRIVETRPLSAKKRWRLLEVLERAR